MSLVSMQGCPHPPTPHPPRRSPWALLERHAPDYTPLATVEAPSPRRRARPATDFGQVPGATQAALRILSVGMARLSESVRCLVTGVTEGRTQQSTLRRTHTKTLHAKNRSIYDGEVWVERERCGETQRHARNARAA